MIAPTYACHGAPLAAAASIRLLLLDVDGVLTDGRLYLGNDGEEYKAFYTRDGLGLKMLQATGVGVGIVTGRESDIVRHRARDLGISFVIQGCMDKRTAVIDLLATQQLPPAAAAFVGDDVIDLPAMNYVGLAIAVADAHPLVRARAHWTTGERGGRGAVREVCELIMHAQGTLTQQLEPRLHKETV